MLHKHRQHYIHHTLIQIHPGHSWQTAWLCSVNTDMPHVSVLNLKPNYISNYNHVLLCNYRERGQP